MELKKVFEIVKLRQVIQEREEGRFVVRSPEDASEFISKEIASEDREVFLVLILNTKNEVIALHRAHVGSLNASIVHPRETFKVAIKNNGASIIVAHNHPSNNAEPSREDIEVTKRLKEAGTMLGIELIDHLVVGYPNKYVSLKERGYL